MKEFLKVGEEMELFINASTLSDDELGSIGRMLIGAIPFFKKYNPKIKIILISDYIIPEDILSKIYFDDIIYNNKYEKKKNTDLFSFLTSYLPWVYKTIEKYRPLFFWEPQNYLLKNFQRTKTIVTIHDLYPLEKIAKRPLWKKLVFKYLIRSTLRNASYIQVPSNFTKQRIIYYFGKDYSSKINVIYHGVSVNENAQNLCVNKRKYKKYIFFVGRLSYWKGTDILLNTAKTIKRSFGLDVLLAGKVIDKDISYQVKRLSEQDVVKYLGFITDEEKESLIRDCEVFLYPSRYDGFGQPPLEAILYNKKVLMSNIPVLKEVTNNLSNYFDITDHTYRSLLEELEKIINSEQTTNIKLYSFVKSLNWQNYAKKFLEMLDMCEC